MISGLLVTTGYMVTSYTFPDWGVLGISHSAAGIFGVPVNFAVTWFVSSLDTVPPSEETRALVDMLRHP